MSLSPDGRFIVTPSQTPAKDGNVLLLIPTDGGVPRELPWVGPPSASPGLIAWASDSRAILFRLQGRDKLMEVVLVNFWFPG